MNLFKSISRAWPTISLDEWASYFSYGGNTYPLNIQQTLSGSQEKIIPDYSGLVQRAYRSNGVVFACMLVRMLLFSEARFAFRRWQNGRPGEMYKTPALNILDTPWVNGTTGDLLTRAIVDVDLSGNAFFTTRDRAPALNTPRSGRIVRMRPDWVTIILGSLVPGADVKGYDLDSEVVGYVYQPGGPSSGEDPVTLLRDEVAHFAPIPDPLARYRGMSWLAPVIGEIMGDQSATMHKLKFFEQGATPNMVISLDPTITRDAFDRWIGKFRTEHEGVMNAYKTIYLGGGANVQVVGANMRQMDFKVTQGAGETRIAAAAGVPPVIVGLSEGLQAATYSNYAQARRRFADGTMRPLWRNMAGSMSVLINVPGDSELWYDDRDIPFLHEDALDATTIRQTQAASIKLLVDAGFDPKGVVDAVVSGDMTRLLDAHTGLYSVQLQPPQPDQLQPAKLQQALPPIGQKSIRVKRDGDGRIEQLWEETLEQPNGHN